jgi:hypothetical protein
VALRTSGGEKRFRWREDLSWRDAPVGMTGAFLRRVVLVVTSLSGKGRTPLI